MNCSPFCVKNNKLNDTAATVHISLSFSRGQNCLGFFDIFVQTLCKLQTFEWTELTFKSFYSCTGRHSPVYLLIQTSFAFVQQARYVSSSVSAKFAFHSENVSQLA